MQKSSYTFDPPYGPIVTSKLLPSFFTQGSWSLYKTDFRTEILLLHLFL